MSEAQSSESRYDLIILGAGPAGYVAAIRAAQLGLKTACIEKDKTLGGTCLNVGCIPSKALLDSSEHFLYAKTKLSKHGVIVENTKLDLPAMMKRKDTVVRQLTGGIDGLFKKNKIDRFLGFGTIEDAKGEWKRVAVKGAQGTQILSAPTLLLAMGSEPASLPFLPFDGRRVINSTEALALTEVPKHLVVIGGGVIGLELGSVWMRLGARVTVVEYQDRILPGMDRQVCKELHKILAKQGMEFRLATKCLGAKIDGKWAMVDVEDLATHEKSKLECDVVLVAVGRRPFTKGMNLVEQGIELDSAGRIVIDEHYQTRVPGVYAIGDLVTGPMLAHKAEEEGIAAVELIAGLAGHVNYRAIPNVVYTWPELASVGESEDQLKERGVEYRVGTFPFIANGRAKAMDETEGLVKILADANTDEVLGVHILGPRASDMIAEAVAVMEYRGSAEDIARTSHAHPTLAEIVKEAALAVDGRQIHL